MVILKLVKLFSGFQSFEIGASSDELASVSRKCRRPSRNIIASAIKNKKINKDAFQRNNKCLVVLFLFFKASRAWKRTNRNQARCTLIGSRNDFRSQPVCLHSEVKHIGQVMGSVFWTNHFGRNPHHHVMALSVDHLRTEVQQRAYLHRLAEEDVVNVDQIRKTLAANFPTF